MKYARVDISDARLLVRSIGLLLNQAAVYGPVHNVTKSATARVYEEVRQLLERYHVLELTVKINLICVNGSNEEIDAAISTNLVRRFAQLDINGLLIVSPLPLREFEKAVKILAMPIALITQAEGVSRLFERENIKAVAVVRVDYKRVMDATATDLEPEPDLQPVIETEKVVKPEPPPPVKTGKIPAVDTTISAPTGVIDLSADLADDKLSYADFGLKSSQEELNEHRQQRHAQSARLAELLRKTAETLENNPAQDPQQELEMVISALERVRLQLIELSRGSEKAISSLAREVDADKLTVAGLEADAIRRGFPLKLTREELLERYAELNQEIVQPLTVSTGVIEMLRKEQIGEISESQQELLKMAHESIDRVNQLVSYMHGVSGLPSTFSPDANLIGDSYN
jgi:hypothetical protein